MRRFIYSTSDVKHPKFFANMCNIVGSEETYPVEFDDYVRDKYQVDVDDLSDEEFDSYFAEYRQSMEENEEVNEVEISEDEVAECSLDISLDADITMKSDGSWDFDDDSWSVCAETNDGSWMTADDKLIATSEQLLQDVNALLQLYLPIEEGTFNITGDLHLVYDMSDEESMFDIAHSTVENFFSAPAREAQGEYTNEEDEENI